MAYQGIGNRAKAACCYDEAVRWMEKKAPEHRDLRRFRAEAAELLQINNRTASQTATGPR
jgi:hypothetical protein